MALSETGSLDLRRVMHERLGPLGRATWQDERFRIRSRVESNSKFAIPPSQRPKCEMIKGFAFATSYEP
jgi:hypothetical protein